jgi:hypothetical protein
MTLLSLGFAFASENGRLACHCLTGSSLREFLRFGFRLRDWNEKGFDDMIISKMKKMKIDEWYTRWRAGDKQQILRSINFSMLVQLSTILQEV